MTLTYVYAEQTAVLGPLSTAAEPHAYDLCDQHSERLSAPRGWEVLRLAGVPTVSGPSDDDLLALADAVREAAVRPTPTRETPSLVPPRDETPRRPGAPGLPEMESHPAPSRAGQSRSERRGHLRVLDSDPTPI